MSGPRSIRSDSLRHGSLRTGSLRASSALQNLGAPGYLSTSPIAHEILARDIAECFDGFSEIEAGSVAPSEREYKGSLYDDEFYRDDDEDSEGTVVGDVHGPGLYLRPSGITYGSTRPAIAPQLTTDTPLPSERERAETVAAERSLLRDNHFLPPKHPRPANEGPLRRLYRRLFSTKVRVPPVVQVVTEVSGGDAGIATLAKVKSATVAVTEITPLLSSDDPLKTPPPEVIEEQFEEAVAAQLIQTTWQREAKTLFQYSRSLAATFLLHYSVTIASVYTVGRIGPMELGAVSLATMTANITCYAVVQGLSTSLDTLCAQAYGSGHKHLVGLQLQRMTYFLWLLLIPICTLWWFSEPVLAAIVPDPETARLASQYLRVLILGTPGVAAFESGKRFVQAQGIFHATTYVLVIGAPLSFVANWFFVWRMGWHFVGAGVAVVCTQNLLPVLLGLYVVLIEGRECWNGLSRKAFHNWGPMIKLALPGMIMVLAQYLAFECLTLAASQFNTRYLAAQSILVTMTSTTFQIPFALSIAASTRVANLIGARLAGAAKTCAAVGIASALFVGLLNCTLLMTLRWKLPQIFSNDSGVVEIVAAIAPTCALLQVFDALAACSHGLLRGIGRQGIGGYANLFSYYCIALPISFGLAFALKWELRGLWIGVICGLIAVAIIEYWYLYQYDWERAVHDAESRMANDRNSDPSGMK